MTATGLCDKPKQAPRSIGFNWEPLVRLDHRVAAPAGAPCSGSAALHVSVTLLLGTWADPDTFTSWKSRVPAQSPALGLLAPPTC